MSRASACGLRVAISTVMVLRATAAHADEVISDPELAGAPATAPRPPAPPSGDQVIEDPELAAAKPASSGGFSSRPEYPHDAVWRVVLGTRDGVDTSWARRSKDIVDGTTIASVEVEQRRSEALLLAVGFRARHAYGVRHDGATRTELDVAPISLYADVTPAAGYHVRGGYQVITMGRFDVFSATNFLAVYDMRSGPVTMADGSAVGQPALRFDYDRVPGFTLTAYYVPFFVPHLVSLYGTDYSVLAPLDRYVDGAPPQFGTDARVVYDAVLGVRAGLDRSAVATGSSNGLRAFAPSPDLTTPQGAVRATFHGTTGELSITAGTALERLPTIGATRELANKLAVPGLTADQVTDALRGETLVHHDRFGVLSTDAAIDAGPLQLGVEVAYQLHRTLVATGTFPAPPGGGAATTQTVVGHTDLVQAGLRAELVEGTSWAAVVEGVGAITVNGAGGGLDWFGLQQGRYVTGVAAGVHFAPEGTGFKAELNGALLSGPSAVFLPRVEWEAVKTVFFELGAVFVEGRTPTTFFGNPRVSIGGLYNDVDQVFTGVRWVP